ncbi:hypothetical protein FDG56_gp110 [Mycobacterium phage Bask21]|uniref:Uncharacterized protein n=1 Tax=Mycobacterium phage Bask21 TaxID=2902889 RepID=G1D0Z4_9CAUD|nr:hypothetical protein FDG56_gp110 [Mycobacterium phage Bask21]AEK08447.1 hypothetical protein PBI_BASK21_146 [Mycobacterium phage Bask21]
MTMTSASAVSRALNRAGVITATTGWNRYGVFVHRHVDGAQIDINGRTDEEAEKMIDRVTSELSAQGYRVNQANARTLIVRKSSSNKR